MSDGREEREEQEARREWERLRELKRGEFVPADAEGDEERGGS